MQYVEGPTLRQRIQAEARLDPKEAAQICLQVAEGLAAAHRAGLIHRDIKPGNVILDSTTGRAKIMDFGLVRTSSVTAATTQEGAILGTPEYMSPEQVREPERIDARSDVYNLGVTLYEALTGETPFRGVPHMMLQQVLHDEPRPPRRLNDRIPRDLETICLQAMAKESGRRYQTAQELADDLRCWLCGEPIRAQPVGVTGKLWRWCGRKPALASTTAALGVAIVVGLAGTTSLWLLAGQRGAEAQQKAQDAEDSFQQAKQAVDDFFTRVSENRLLKRPGSQRLRQELLNDALGYYQRFLEQRGDDAGLEEEVAKTHGLIGFISMEMGLNAEALAAYNKARIIREKLADQNRDVARYEYEVADTYFQIGNVQREMGETAEALSWYLQSRSIFEKLAERYPGVLEYQCKRALAFNNIGLVQEAAGKTSEALDSYQRARDILADVAPRDSDVSEFHKHLALAWHNIGVLQGAAGQATEAIKSYEQARAIQEKLVAQDEGDTDAQTHLGRSYINLGRLQAATGGSAMALRSWDEAAKLFQKLADQNPDVPEFKRRLATAFNNMGTVQVGMSFADALNSYRKAHKIQKEVATRYPKIPEYQKELASTCVNLGITESGTGGLIEGLGFLEEARVILEQLVDHHREVTEFRIWLARAYCHMAGPQIETDQPSEALRSCRRAEELFQELVSHNPHSAPDYRSDLGLTWGYRGGALWKLGQREEALAAYRQAVDHQRKAFNIALSAEVARQALTQLYHLMAQLQRELGRPAEAATTARDIQELWPNHPSELYNVACDLAQCIPLVGKSKTELTAEEQADRKKYADEAMEVLRQALPKGFKDADHLKKDPDLDPLRSREDFKKLLAELDEKAKAGAK